MKLRWRKSVVTGDAHLCVEDDNNNVATVCGAPFLTGTVEAGEEDNRCPDCVKIDLSGEEIAALDIGGKKFIIREKQNPAHTGTLDPFHDIAEQLKKMNVMYTLIVGRQGYSRLNYWTNIVAFGKNGIAATAEMMNDIIKTSADEREKIDQDRK